MNSKDLVIRALHGEKTERVPAGYHGWGMYKFALKGILEDYSLEKEVWKIHGEELAGVEISVQNQKARSMSFWTLSISGRRNSVKRKSSTMSKSFLKNTAGKSLSFSRPRALFMI